MFETLKARWRKLRSPSVGIAPARHASWARPRVPGAIDVEMVNEKDERFPFLRNTLSATRRARSFGGPGFAESWPQFRGKSGLGDWLVSPLVEARDPISGKVRPCVGSVMMPAPSECGGGSRGPTVAYLFNGEERFALLTGLPSSLVFALWLVDRGIILIRDHFSMVVMEDYCRNRLRRLFEEAFPEGGFDQAGCLAPGTERWYVCEVHRNIGHSIWEELGYMEDLAKAGFRGTFASMGYDVVPTTEFFPETGIAKRRFGSEAECNVAARDAGALLFRVSHEEISASVLERVRSWAETMSRAIVPTSLGSGPGIWIGLRGFSPEVNNRGVCLNQEEAYLALIDHILERSPDAWFVIDGVTSLWSAEGNFPDTPEAEMAGRIGMVLSSRKVPFDSLVGAKIDKKIVRARACDFLVCSYGASLAIPGWIGDLPGVAHTVPEFVERWARPDMYSRGWKGNRSRTGELRLFCEVEIDSDGNYKLPVKEFLSHCLEALDRAKLVKEFGKAPNEQC